MRVRIISHWIHKKQEETREQNELKRLDLLASQTPTNSVIKDLMKTKNDLNNTLNENTEYVLLRFRQQHFEIKLVNSQQIKTSNQEIHPFTLIVDPSGNTRQNPSMTNDSFRPFNSNLYKSYGSTSPEEAESFLRNVSLPKLTKNNSMSSFGLSFHLCSSK